MLALLIGLLALGLTPSTVGAQGNCVVATVSAYSVEQYPGRTADGTPTRGNAGVIAAGGADYALGSYVWVEGLGTYRIADRGNLAASQVDVLMQTTYEALQHGVPRLRVCRA